MKALALKNAGTSRTLGPSELLEGKYRLERVLGAGAMGRVWLARNIRLDAPVAIKIVERDLHGEEAMARVLKEARLEARLRHPNIVRVLDCHTDDDLSYVVMELLEGCTLADLMDEGPLPPALAVRLLLPLVDGLALAHQGGVVHRDIKPENVFIARAGERICPKLLDFGIAHVMDEPGKARNKRRMIVGTPGYMAPEQAYGERDIDPRADIWSLGVVLYEAISGESAFGCASYQDYLRALNERVLPALPQSGGGAELWQIVQRALCPSHLGRFPSCGELADALRAWLRGRGVREDLSGDTLSPSWSMSGSIVDRALRRAAARHAAFGERDSYAPTQPDLTTRRKPHCSGERHTDERPSAVSGSGESSRDSAPSLPPLSPANSRASTIRTIPRARGGGKRERWSACALLAGAVFGVSFALVEARGEPPAPRRLSSAAHVVKPATPQPTAAALAAAAFAADPETHLSQRAAAGDFPRAARAERDGADAHSAAAKAAARPKPQKRTAPVDPLRKQASALGLKSPW